MGLRYRPGQTKDINVFVSGMGMLGLAKTAKLPEVKTKKESQNGQHVDTGMLEPMEAEFELSSLNEMIYLEMAKLEEATFKIKGAMVENGKDKNFVATLRGSTDVDTDAFEPGKALNQKVKIYVNTYDLKIDGKEILAIDVPNYIAVIMGRDIYAAVRAALT